MSITARLLLMMAFCAVAGGTAATAAAQSSTTKVRGIASAAADGMPANTVNITFACTGEPTCSGTYEARFSEPGCSTTSASDFTMTGLDLSRAGPIAGNLVFRNWDWTPVVGCNPPPGAVFEDYTFAYTGSWSGSSGTFSFTYGETSVVFRHSGSFQADRGAPPPVFPMEVSSNITGTSANVTATFQPRPQDVGTSASVFVFAVAPAPLVKSSNAKAAHFGHIAIGDSNTPVQCVLAQLSGGQLTAVSASTMQAYVSGVLDGSRQAVTMLNGVPTVNVAGATFYLGYGTSAAAMLENGLNRSAATAPGTVQCKPEAPETGWWWNPAEGGRGYSVEVRGNKIFFAAFHYDVSGRSTWHVATGDGVSLDGSLYANKPLYQVTGGQTLAGTYRGKPSVTEIGKITLAFADKRTGTMVWPGGVVPIERFNIVPGGLAAAPKASQPESGWWWNPEEDGRGFFMEWQNGTIDLAGYMYDDQGNPVWYLSVYDTANIRAMAGNWWSYANGQSMTGVYKPATRVSDNVAPVTITFSGPDTALMTLPNGRTTQLQRHRF